MEVSKMNYYFTGILIILMCLLALFVSPAHSKNEYLHDNFRDCRTGEVDLSIERRDTDYNYSDSSTHENENLRLTFRKYLGTACTDEYKKLQMENMQLKQLMELMKKCDKINKNPSYLRNPAFTLLVQKCYGIIPISKDKINDERPDGNHWDNLKKDYMEKNPDNYMGIKKKLKIPPEEILTLPLPKPINE